MLLAFDLDNTVVTKDQRLPDEIVSAIQAARRAGHVVTVLTGRTKVSAMPYLEKLKVSGPYSVNHGALVIGHDGGVLQQAVIPAHNVQTILRRYQKTPELEYSCVVGDTLYVRDPLDKRWNWAHTLDQHIVPFERFNGHSADKIVFSVPLDGERIHREIAADFPELVLYLWEDFFLEITGANGHKGAALELIATSLGVPQRDTIAFGDGVNDVTMLEWAGRAVAVGPYAYPDVLAVADEHIAAPEELGVARWLETNLLTGRP